MKSSTGEPGPRSDTVLVSPTAIEAGLQEQASRVQDKRPALLEREPFLNELIEMRCLQIAGKMVMNEIAPEVIRGVTCDMHQLVDLAVNVVDAAHRALWDGFLPDTQVVAERPDSGAKPNSENSERSADLSSEDPKEQEGR